jgi:glycosyltransferase involved in cell wall biosynthesis
VLSLIKNPEKKIKVAIISMSGMARGGVASFLRQIATQLDSDLFDVHFFWCDPINIKIIGKPIKYISSAPEVISEMKRSGVSCHQYSVDTVDRSKKKAPWIGTNFFEVFNENYFDLVLTGRGGNPEYPFCKIKKVPIIDTIHLRSGIDRQPNIVSTLHLSKENQKLFFNRGGKRKKIPLISPMIYSKIQTNDNLRFELGINTKFVIGMHQRNSDELFSYIPLQAFEILQSKYDVSFILLNGSSKYITQARALKLRNIHFLPETDSEVYKQKFLNTLDVYTHGRADGEIHSAAIAEALRHGKPVITHCSPVANGQEEQIENCGYFVHTLADYTSVLQSLLEDSNLLYEKSSNARIRFIEEYNEKNQLDIITNVLLCAYKKTHLYFFRIATFLVNFLNNYFSLVLALPSILHRKLILRYLVKNSSKCWWQE